MPNPHVTHIISNLDRAGAQILLFNILNVIRKFDDVKISVVSIDSGVMIEEYKENGFEVYNINEKGLVNPKIYFKLKKLLQQLNPDIVHTHLLKADFYGRIAAKHSGVKHIISTCHNDSTIHTRPIHGKKNIFDRIDNFVIDYTDSHIFAISEKVKDYLIERKGDNNINQRVTVIHNGVVIPQYKIDVAKCDTLKKEFGLREDDFIVLLIGRLEEQKGHLPFIEEVKDFISENRNIKIIFAGEGSKRIEIENTIKKYGLQNNFILPGNRKDIPELITISNMLVQPSVWEGFGLTIAEGMVYEKIVLASNVGGIPEIIQDGKNGFLFDLNSPGDLLNKFRKIYFGYKEIEQIGNNAKATVIEKFDINKNAKKYNEYYKRILGNEFQV